MNLKPELLATLTSLGITEAELPILYDRMLSLITGYSATITALDAQIATLSAQRDEVTAKLFEGQAIATKLIVPQVE